MWKWELELIAGLAIVFACLLLILVLKFIIRALQSGGQIHNPQSQHQQQQHRRGGTLYLRHEDSQGTNSPTAPRFRNNASPRRIVPFDWKDHPVLMSQALENGWSAFALSQILFDQQHQHLRPAELRWEIGPGTEFMQLIRSNPAIPASQISVRSIQFFRSALPLPGPYLGPYSYPQEAYFEITIAAADADSISDDRNHRARLIKSSSNSAAEVDCFAPIGRIKSGRVEKIEPLFSKIAAIGLITAPNCSFAEDGSIGFYSTGQILLNGEAYTDERFKRKPWSLGDTTVGCGFDPKLRKVFFTINGEIACQASCINSDDFGHPLHAAFLCNYDATTIVNLGQSPFEFGLENLKRISDPGNFHRLAGKLHDEASGDLFSVENNSRCLDEHSVASPALSQDLRRPAAAPSEAESELFEIVLDAGGHEIIIHR